MEITVHKHLIEQCGMMACASKADRDKALWLTMAQSWGRLADEVERSRTVPDHKALFQRMDVTTEREISSVLSGRFPMRWAREA